MGVQRWQAKTGKKAVPYLNLAEAVYGIIDFEIQSNVKFHRKAIYNSEININMIKKFEDTYIGKE